MGMKWTRHGFPWVVAAVPVAALLLWAGLALDLPEPDGVPGPVVARPDLRVTIMDPGQETTMGERLKLLDPTPLFLPSPLSSSQLDYPRAEGDAEGAILKDYEPRLVAADWYAPDGGGLAQARPLPGAMDVIGATEIRLPFLGLGRDELKAGKLPRRWALASVYSLKSRAVVEQLDLPPPVAAGFPDTLWSPMEFLLLTEADGIVGGAELLAGSGIPEVDEYVLNTIKSTFALGGGLRPGIYRLVVGQ